MNDAIALHAVVCLWKAYDFASAVQYQEHGTDEPILYVTPQWYVDARQFFIDNPSLVPDGYSAPCEQGGHE